MNRPLRIAAFALTLTGAAVLRTGWSTSGPAPARARGVSLGLFASTPDFDYGGLVREIAARGARDILVVVPWFQSDVHANIIETTGPGSPDPASVTRTIAQAHAAGLRVALMPIVRLRDRSGGAWRGQIDADADAWFSSYRRALVSLAERAQGRAVRLVVGSELSAMVRHAAHWRTTVAQVRAVFSGALTYSANWDAYQRVPFWDALDAVGITGYFPLAEGEPDRATVKAAWRRPLADARAFARARGRPLILTELGYPDHRLAAARPWDRFADAKPAPALQARLLSVACELVVEHDGIYIWNWFGAGGRGDRGYSPRGKPAAAVIERCLRSANT